MKGLKRLVTVMKHDVLLFPSELTDFGQITIRGNNQFLIENVYVLQYFSTVKIEVVARNNHIEIHGSAFYLKTMYKDELLIEGEIKTITFTPS